MKANDIGVRGLHSTDRDETGDDWGTGESGEGKMRGFFAFGSE
jgi:hypothetical protein